MTRLLAGLTLAALGAAAFAQGPRPAPRAAAPVVDDDAEAVVFLGEGRPYLIRLHVYTHGRPLRFAWQEFVARVFAELDTDRNGSLSAKEVVRLTQLGLRLDSFASGGTRQLFAESLRRTYGPFRVRGGGGNYGMYVRQILLADGSIRGQQGGAENTTAALFRRLDADGDGVLSAEEIAAAAERLRKQDLDDDECVTVAEVLGRGPRGAAEGVFALAFVEGMLDAEGSGGPLVAVEVGGANLALGRRLLAHYGKDGAQRLTRAEIGLDDAAFARLDADGDGTLDAAELARFARGPADLELTVRVGTRTPGQPAVELTNKKGAEPLPLSGAGGVGFAVELGSTRLDWHVGDAPGGPKIVFDLATDPAGGAEQQAKEQFKAADRDKNGYLDANEARQSPLFGPQFAAIDADGDGKLFEKEVLAYVARTAGLQRAAAMARVSVGATDQGNGLFDLLDADHDGRLTERELRQVPAALRVLDRNKDGRLARSEVPRNYRIDVGPAPAAAGGYFAIADVDVRVWTAGGNGQRPEPKDGPLWFRKMDRNKDGDVSRREFLGTDEQFRRIDADGDRLISPKEADAFDKQARPQ